MKNELHLNLVTKALSYLKTGNFYWKANITHLHTTPRYFKEPGILFKTAAVMRTIAFVATEDIHDEELFVK